MKEKEENGITLIALVVTIIILLILAGVTLNRAISGSGLFNRAGNATEKYKIAQEYEREKLVEIEEKMDLIPPSIPTIELELENGGEYKEGEWTNQNVKITFSALDEGGSGITSYEYSLDGKNSEGVITSGYVIDTEGITNISIRAVDKAGNKGDWSEAKTIKRDTVAPTVTLTGRVNGSTNVTLTGTGTDSLSKVYYQWSTSSTAPSSEWTSANDTTTNAQTRDVTQTYYFWVKDEVGNMAKETATIWKHEHSNNCYYTCPGTMRGHEWDSKRQVYNCHCDTCGKYGSDTDDTPEKCGKTTLVCGKGNNYEFSIS